jgi:UDP-2,4-diacetamido-2,4,6-trideoxy-beta-L-altropyranose hydrolase
MAVAFAIRTPPTEAPSVSLFCPFEILTLPPIQIPEFADTEAPPHSAWLSGGWQADADTFISLLRGRTVAAVIIDHYAIDARWHMQVASALGCHIVAIDDLADRPLEADLIIDHNVAADHQEKYATVNRTGCPVLGGPRYALLDNQFAIARRNPADDPVRSVGVFMGGADASNLTFNAWQGLRDIAGFSGIIEVATTRANPHLSTLAALSKIDPALTITIDSADLSSFFGRHELHIGAGGGATWERCCLGAPTLALIAAKNQRQVLLPLAHQDVCTVVETELPDAHTIGQQARALIEAPSIRKRQSKRACTLVDGHGCARVAEQIATLCLQ